MRTACLLLIALAPIFQGCAALVARSGKDLTDLKTKEEFRAALGEPDRVEVSDGEVVAEEYRTRRKIAVPLSPAYGMALVMSWGTSELIDFPCEVYHAGRRTILGQTIRVDYGNNG